MNCNFYFTGTLRENLGRKIHIDEGEVREFVELLKIGDDIEEYDVDGLDSKIYYENTKVNYELTKKLCLLRILLARCKIVIIKDTASFVGMLSIPEILRKYIPNCTIIKINNKIESAYGCDRVVFMENSVVI